MRRAGSGGGFPVVVVAGVALQHWRGIGHAGMFLAAGAAIVIDALRPAKLSRASVKTMCQSIAVLVGAYLAMSVVPLLMVGVLPTPIAYGAPVALFCLGVVPWMPALAGRYKLWQVALFAAAAGILWGAVGPT